MRRENHQGGAFALLRRLSSFVDEQLVKPGTGGQCSTDRPLSSLSVGEEGLAGISSLVDKICHLGREVDRIRRVWDAHRFPIGHFNKLNLGLCVYISSLYVLCFNSFFLFPFLFPGLKSSCSVNLNDIGYNFIKKHPEMEPLLHSTALQQYILLCAQVWHQRLLNVLLT